MTSKIRLITAVLAGMLTVNGMGDSIEGTTYAKLFDRALALTPGETKVDHDLTKTGEWEFVGARGIKVGDKLSIEAQNDKFEMTWKIWEGGFKRVFPLRLRLQVEDDDAGAPDGAQPPPLFKIYPTDTPLRVLPYVFTRDRFNSLEDEKTIIPGKRKSGSLTFNLPVRDFGGFKLAFEGLDGKSLAGKTFVIKNIRLEGEYVTGCFRREIELPAGEIWAAVAEVGNPATLFVNGQRVDDTSIITPRPHLRGPQMYHSRRIALRQYLKPGRNVFGMQGRSGYLRGSIIMDSGERIPFDSGTNWVWNREAPTDWTTLDYDAADWMPITETRQHPGEARAISVLGDRGVLSRRPPGDMPCYDGLIKLRNPQDKKLVFDQQKPFCLETLIPPGLEDKQPELAWELNRYNPDGTFIEITGGSVKNFEMKEDSLSGLINSENIKRGIYVLTSRLKVEGEIIEEREPEPLVVTGKVKTEKSAGDFWEDGLELTLEKIIDFTDPNDPHPWFETDGKGRVPLGHQLDWGPDYYRTMDEPLIVERNGLKYRETRPAHGAQFSYKVDFQHGGDWYLLVLEYPDDAERWIGVSCNAGSRMSPPPVDGKERADGGNKCGPAIWTGGKYPNTGKMLEMKWVYRADPGSHSINVMSLMRYHAAAVARLRIYHIAGRLPELDVGDTPVREQRRFGMLTERTYPWGNGIHTMFSSYTFEDAPESRSDGGAGLSSSNVIQEACRQLFLLEDASSHFAEYMRFAGQNIHVMGCYQYHDGNTASQYLTGDPRLHYSPENVLARVLQANDLMFYASVEFSSNSRRYPPAGRAVTDQDYYFADRTGGKPVVQRRGFTPGMNFLHPQIEGDMLEVARQLAEAFKHQPNFLGINWTSSFGPSWLPSYRGRNQEDPLDLGYDDFTIGLFEKETGIKVPGGEGQDNREPGTVNREPPSKYEQRYQFLTSAKMKPVWLAWRAQKMFDFFSKMEHTIRQVRPDLEVVAGCYLDGRWHIREWKQQGGDFKTYLQQAGWSPEKFKSNERVWLMPWLYGNTRYYSAHRLDGYAMAWQGNQDSEFYRAFTDLERRALMLCMGWHEVERIAAHFPWREGWPRPFQQTMMGQQREEMAMEPYTQALIGFDPQMIMMGFTDSVPYIGVEGMQRKFTRVLRRLPWNRFEPVLDTGFDTDFAIRALRRDQEFLFYVANPGYWPVNGTVTLTGAERVVDLVSGKTMALENGVMDVELDPFGIAAFRAVSSAAPDKSQIKNHRSKIHITAWSTEPLPESELAHMRGIIGQAREYLGKPDIQGFLGDADYAILQSGTAKAEQALVERRHAAAWAALTDGTFWTVLNQKAGEMQFADMVKPRMMAAYETGSGLAPKIDGVLDDRIWKDGDRAACAKPAGNFVRVDKKYAEWKTWVRVMRSGNRLFIAFELHDPEPDQIRGTADATESKSLWGAYDDTVAFFIKPPQGDAYYQFAVSANGTMFSQKNSPAGKDYNYAPNWRAATARNAKGWAVEVELDTVDAFGTRIDLPGSELKINFHRKVRMDDEPHSSWTYSSRWHDMEQTGTLKFIKRGETVR